MLLDNTLLHLFQNRRCHLVPAVATADPGRKHFLAGTLATSPFTIIQSFSFQVPHTIQRPGKKNKSFYRLIFRRVAWASCPCVAWASCPCFFLFCHATGCMTYRLIFRSLSRRFFCRMAYISQRRGVRRKRPGGMTRPHASRGLVMDSKKTEHSHPITRWLDNSVGAISLCWFLRPLKMSLLRS